MMWKPILGRLLDIAMSRRITQHEMQSSCWWTWRGILLLECGQLAVRLRERTPPAATVMSSIARAKPHSQLPVILQLQHPVVDPTQDNTTKYRYTSPAAAKEGHQRLKRPVIHRQGPVRVRSP
jgi:hypothetical protein